MVPPIVAIPLGVVAGSKALGWCLRRKHSIKSKVVLLTGASRGLGAEMAVELAKEGVKLCLVARDQAALAKVAEECKKAGAAEVIFLSCDVSDPKACEEMVKACKAKLGAVEILINNAGIEFAMRMQDVSIHELAQLNAVNVTAPMVLARLVLPDMLAAKYGVICVLSSGYGGMYTPYMGCYAATKHAVNCFCASLRTELQGTGVSCFAVMPGIITKLKDGGMGAQLFTTDVLEKRFSLNPLDFLLRCTAASVIRKVIAHVKLRGPNPIVNAMRIPLSGTTIMMTLFPVTATKLMFETLPMKGAFYACCDKRAK